MQAERSKNLIVVAHPDDESLFMAGHILKHKALRWEAVYVTDANGGGRKQERRQEFEKACKSLGVTSLGSLDFPDVFDTRLPWREVQRAVTPLLANTDRVWTHGAIGEYGHIHHQDVSRAVHEAALAQKVEAWSFAYNSKPELVTELSPAHYGEKLKILLTIYGKETLRFINLLNSSYAEAFAKIEIEELRGLYDFLAEDKALPKLLPHYGLLRAGLESREYFSSVPSFFKAYFK